MSKVSCAVVVVVGWLVPEAFVVLGSSPSIIKWKRKKSLKQRGLYLGADRIHYEHKLSNKVSKQNHEFKSRESCVKFIDAVQAMQAMSDDSHHRQLQKTI